MNNNLDDDTYSATTQVINKINSITRNSTFCTPSDCTIDNIVLESNFMKYIKQL